MQSRQPKRRCAVRLRSWSKRACLSLSVNTGRERIRGGNHVRRDVDVTPSDRSSTPRTCRRTAATLARSNENFVVPDTPASSAPPSRGPFLSRVNVVERRAARRRRGSHRPAAFARCVLAEGDCSGIASDNLAEDRGEWRTRCSRRRRRRHPRPRETLRMPATRNRRSPMS